MSFATDLGLAFPLIQAPMAGVQDARLALAANAAGALGSLPAAMLDATALEAALRALHDAQRPYNVNFFTHVPPTADVAVQTRWRETLAPYYDEFGIDSATLAAAPARRPFGPDMAEVLESFRPAVVSFHFGLPAPALLARVKARGAMVLSSATTVDEARWLQQHGADAIIAQGLEAGGHRGHFLAHDPALQAATARLLPAIVAAVDVPVVAAGGIANADGVRAALRAGAAAVQVGTAFLRCDEATTSALHRQRLRDLAAPTVLTNVFTGGLARSLLNRAVRELGPVSALAPPFPDAAAAVMPLRAKAEAQGQDDFSPLWSGADRSGCRDAPAAEVVQQLATGFAG